MELVHCSYNDAMLWRRVLRYHGHLTNSHDDGQMRMLVNESSTLPLILQELAEHGEELALNLEPGTVNIFTVVGCKYTNLNISYGYR